MPEANADQTVVNGDFDEIRRAKRLVWDLLRTELNDGPTGAARALAKAASDDFAFAASHPVNEIEGARDVGEAFWRPLIHAFPDLCRRTEIFLGGRFDGLAWVAVGGVFAGVFARNWLGLPATGNLAFLRFSQFFSVDGDRLTSSRLLLDIVDLARQAGVDLVPRGLGAEMRPPAPQAMDGLRIETGPDAQGETSLKLVEAMMAGLGAYDGEHLEVMDQARFWRPDMMWYGPSGIGAARGLCGFQDRHQRPFLAFVPDRVGGDHFARFGDGPFVASGGWPSIRATTSGAPWISTPLPGGVPVTMRVMDFWRREGDLLAENWVFIDIPDVFRQCGVDVFENLKA